MIRKIEDIKINKSKILKLPKKETLKIEVSNVEFVSKSEPKSSSIVISEEEIHAISDTNQNKKEFRRFDQKISQTPKIPKDRRLFGRKNIFIIAILVIAITIFYLLSTVFLRANIRIIPKSESFDLSNKVFHASKDGEIPFELMIISDDGSKDITLTKTKEVSEKAKGEITLYNEYSTKPEKILLGTFVSDSDGKTYKIDKTVTIPGFTKDKLKIIPGEVSVGITSFLAGDAYNGNPEYFNINSFKDTPKYKKIYGKLKSPLVGGASGLVYVFSDSEKSSAISDLSVFQEKIIRKLNAEIPDGYILYKDGIKFTYEYDQDVFSKTKDVTLSIKGTASAYIYKEDILVNYIINKLLPNISEKEKSEIVPPDISSLVFNFVNKNQLIDKDVNNFDFTLKGNLNINWSPDLDSLKVLLIGKNKADVPFIFKEDPGISSASVKIIPFWSSKLPTKENKIKITVDR